MSSTSDSPPSDKENNFSAISQGQASLSLEEQKILSSCQSESFWYRSIPIGAFLAGTAHLAVSKGYLKSHPSWGARPKVILGSIIGYFLGKFSYVDVCADKFLIEAPDSNIAEAIRARRGLPSRRNAGQPQIQEEEYRPYQQLQQPSPIYQNQASPTYGQYGLYKEQQQEASIGSYEELRRKNREAAGQPQGSSSTSSSEAKPQYSQPLNIPMSDTQGGSKARVILPKNNTNKYGDEGFE